MTQKTEDIGADVKQIAWLMAGAALAPLILLAMGERLGLSSSILNICFAVLATLVALAVAGLQRTLSHQFPQETRLIEPAGVRGVALATEVMSAALFVGLAGAIYGMGYDGLAFVLGIAGGLFLMTLIAPGLKRYPGDTLADVLGARFESSAVRRFAAAISFAALLLLLAAELQAVARAGSLLVDVGRNEALWLAGGIVLAMVLLSQTARSVGLSAAVYLLILAGFLAPLVWLAWTKYGMPVPHAGFGAAVADLTRLETDLIVKKLADPRSLIPATLPFQTFDSWSFQSLVLVLAAGVAVFPHFLARLLPARTPAETRHAAARGLFYGTLFLISVPVLAIFGKLLVFTELNRPIALAEPAPWVVATSAKGLLKICGAAPSSAADVAQACLKAPGSKGQLRLQDVAIAGDDVVFSLPVIGAMPGLIFGVFTAAVLLAGFITATALTRAVQRAIAAFGPDETVQTLKPPALTLIAFLTLAAATALAAWHSAGLVALVAASATLLAASLFPVVVIGLLWPRASASGALAGMGAGLAVGLVAVAGSAFLPDVVQQVWASFATTPSSAANTLDGLRQSWRAAATPEVKAAAFEALQAHARSMPLWFGLKPLATGIVALPVAAAVLVAVTLSSGRSETV